ncbi:hypothetical protein BGZ76_008363 [Entomortierella beljakovae]|nr:hypothetical protein BGZ76_008363 [Entomortierella beljakovae]
MSFGGPISRDTTGTIRRRDITLSVREKQLYGQLWAAADKDNNGFVTGADAVPFFAKSGLSPQVLGQIWVLADSDNKGVLGQQGFSIAVKLIAHAQNAKTPSASLIDIDAPLPHFEGITPKVGSPVATSLSPIASQNTGSEPALTPEDKTKYGGMFVACGPIGGLLEGDKAREVFLKSKLPVDKLSQIWSLADTKQRGSLDMTDFTIAMYYIQHTMDGSIKNLPSVLPQSVLKACSGSGGGATGLVASPVLSAQTINRQLTGNNINMHSNTIARQLTGNLGGTPNPLSKQNTGGANNIFGSASASSVTSSIPWDVTPEEKIKFDRFFDQLDSNGDGIIEGEEAGKFFMNSRLPETVLAQIWDLSDITGTGSLTKDEFAVAMLLINRKNATGAPIPKSLPLSLVPPSLRNRVAGSSAFSVQDSARSMSTSSTPLRRLSFDLLGDGPTSSISNKQPENDLIGDDLKNKITSETGDLASMQNQINNLTNVTGDLQAKRTMMEKNLHVLSAQKQDISIRLNQIKTLHESETRVIKETESAISVIQPQLIKLREELEVSERSLAIARANKDEFLLSLAKDQEENNRIKVRLQKNNEEIFKLREELELKKKDTGRQKGLLEIARRQADSSDADKQKIINEIAQESEKAAQIAKEAHAIALGTAAVSSGAVASTAAVSQSSGHSSPALPSSGLVPPVPAPRGSRKEPPPPPASRGSNFSPRATPDVEEAFGIPEALRSPTGSFHSATSQRSGAPQGGLSRQSTGSTPFDIVPRQSTGSSPFETLSRQGTGSTPFDSTIERQATGSSTRNPQGESVEFVAAQSTGASNTQEELWSPRTHAAQVPVGQAALSVSPVPESSPFGIQQESPFGIQPGASGSGGADPFETTFPAATGDSMGDFDSAFSGFTDSKPPAFRTDSDHSAKAAFEEAFPDIDTIGGADGSKSKRVSAFGFEDDFSSDSFGQSHAKSKEDDEFPPIVEVSHQEEDSSDDEADEVLTRSPSNSAAQVDPFQAAAAASNAVASNAAASVSSNASPFSVVTSTTTNITTTSTSAEVTQSSTTVAAPVATAAPIEPVTTGSKKLTKSDFSEFESFNTSSNDFDDAFSGVELSAPKVNTGGGAKIAGFDDGFEGFNTSFDDAFGSSTSPFGAPASQKAGATNSNAFGTVDLDEAFGGFAVSGNNNGTSNSNAFDNSNAFGDFEAQFSTSSPPQQPVVTAASQLPPPTAVPVSTSVKATSAATPVPGPPAVELQGVGELMNMGFSKQQAEDALLRYDNVERAANFLLEGGQ